MPCSCFNPQSFGDSSPVCRQNNCPSFGKKSMPSGLPTEQALFVLCYMVSIKQGLWTGYKTWTWV